MKLEANTYMYHPDGQLTRANYGGNSEEFLWDGLALVRRGDEHFVNEPHVGNAPKKLRFEGKPRAQRSARRARKGPRGNPVASSKGTSYFNDALGTTLGSKSNGKYSPAALSAFGEDISDSSNRSPFPVPSSPFFTGKPYIEGLGHAFLMRNYRAGFAKWQTADPLGYPDGWNQLAYVNNLVLITVDLYGCVNWSTIWQGTKAVLGGTAEIVSGSFLVANVETAGVTQVAGVLLFMDGLGRVGLGFANITAGFTDHPEVPASYAEVTADVVKQLTDADDNIVDNAAKVADYAIGLATPDPSGGKIIDILGALDDIATADDAMHDVAESIENLLKDLGFIEE